jgi:DNA sulfur modification protein DndB
MTSTAFTYQFTSLRGRQAGREYYVSMCPMNLLPKMFAFEEELKPEVRAQRKLNKGRIPELTRYILQNPKEYVFSALTASIDGEIQFTPLAADGPNSNLGILQVPMNARFVINDGQHRRAAIEAALAECPDLGNETIAVVFFVDAGLKRSQQMFSDLNKHSVRPTKSLGILYDHRDPLSQLARDLSVEVPAFRDLTETERSTISNRSRKLFTLSSIYLATRALLSKPARAEVSPQEARLANDFWTEVGKNMSDWQLAAKGEISSAELRKDYIHSHGVALHALAIAGADLIRAHPTSWKQKLKDIHKIDWSRNNRGLWEGRATIGGRVSKATNNIVLSANVIKRQLRIALTATEERVEEMHGKGRKGLGERGAKPELARAGHTR